MSTQIPQYPVDVMPIVMREAVWEVHHNVQAPIALCAGSAITVLSAAAAEKVKVIMPYGGEPKPVGVYSLIMAESGERKTAVDKIFGKMLSQRDARFANQYLGELARFKTEERIWRKTESKLVGRIADRELNEENTDDLRAQLEDHIKRKPEAPRLRCLIHQDMSERAIMEALEGDGKSIALMCNEGELLLRSAVLNKPSLLNKAWDGGPFHFDRKDRKIVATDTRATVSIMVQNAVLKDYLSSRGEIARGSGMWARFLMCWPPSMQGTRYTCYIEPSWERVDKFHARIEEVLNDEKQQVYEFDVDAKVEFITLLNRIELEIRPWWGSLADINDFASKAGENIARIAAQFHHVSQQTGKITVDTLTRAWSIVKWHLDETKRIFTPAVVPQVQIDAQALELYLGSHFFGLGLPVSVPRNAVLRSGPVRLAARFSDALDFLEAQGKIWIGSGANRRRFINPGRNWVNVSPSQ